jgi:membrane-bound lytic murein transglycosylase A
MPHHASRTPTLTALLLAAAPLSACVVPPVPPLPELRPHKKDFSRALPPGARALQKVHDPAAWPRMRLAAAERAPLKAACERSLSYLAKPSSRGFFPMAGFSHAQVRESVAAFVELLDQGGSEADLIAALRARFDCYRSVGCDGEGSVLFTGYYTPIFEASLERSERFTVPLHKLPENHVKDPRSGVTLGLRDGAGNIDPSYPSRAALLSSGLLEGRELAWLAEPFEAYIVGVQGSACLSLPDGRRFGVGYAGTNGKPYSSLGQALIAAGKLRPEQLSLKGLIDYFRRHPEEFGPLSAHNERYVFFQEGDGTPRGCLNEPVTTLHSIATDKSIFPRAALCFVEAEQPATPGRISGGARGFALDQDAGGAIRAPGRCDIYMGVGEAAGSRAGHTLSEGRLFYFLLKPEAAAARAAQARR